MEAHILFLLIFLQLPLAIFAKTEILPPVIIQKDKSLQQSSRSVLWPVIDQELTPAVNLPQMDDALNSLNGLQVRTQGSPTVSIRGSAQNGRALLLYNHIPLNFGSGFGAPRIFFPKEALEKLAIIKGPASLFYGSQAMAGAVDLIPRKYHRPELSFNFSDTDESFLPWRQGSLAHQSWQLASPLYQTKKTHVQTSLFHENDDGRFPYQNRNVSGVREFNAQNLSRITSHASTQFSNVILDFDSILGRHIQQSPGPTNFSLRTRQETEGVLLSLSPLIFFSDEHSLRSRLSFLQSESDFLENNTETYTNQKTIILQNEWVYDISRFSKLQFFADAFLHELDNSYAGDGLTQGQLELGPFFSFHSLSFLRHQVGGRFLFEHDKFLPTLSTHLLWDSKDLWLSFAEGFRNPTLTDLFSNSPFFIGNPNLQAETSRQYELGIKNMGHTLNSFHWEFRIFLIEYQNFIESFETTPGVFSRANRGEGYAQGFDASIRWQGPLFATELSYNFLDTKDRQLSRPFRLSPEHQISGSLFYTMGLTQLQIQNTHWYNTYDVTLNEMVALEDWQQWNFFLHLDVFKKTRLSLGLINAFNEGKQLTLNYPEPQRKYWLRVQQTF